MNGTLLTIPQPSMKKKNVKHNCEDEIVRNNPDSRCNLQVRPRRKAALTGELARRLSSKQISAVML